MSRIRGLELLFNLEKKNLRSSEDCVVAALHCLLINENMQCVGTGDEWPGEEEGRGELLPADWNSDQDAYSLRYVGRDLKSRVLLKVTKMEHVLQVDAVLNEEDAVASTCVPVANHASYDAHSDFSACYKDLDSLGRSFCENIVQELFPRVDERPPKKDAAKSENPPPQSSVQPPPRRPAAQLRQERRSEPPFGFPRVGGSDLDPFGGMGGGGMLMDPSGFGIPARPTLPQFGVGGPGGLPRGAVPPGARFDPFMPPIYPAGRFGPDPDHFRPPDFDDFL